MAKVLVTDAGMRNVVSIIRSLGKRGIEVVVAENTRWALGGFSKYCKKLLVCPSPIRHPDQWLHWLIKELSQNRYDMLMPVSGYCAEVIAKNLKIIEKYTKVGICDYSTWIKANNKAQTIKLAMQHQIPCPETHIISDLDEVEKLAKEVRYPIVIKPTESTGSRGIVYVHKKDDLVREYLKIHSAFPFPMLQEFIPPGGKSYGVFFLFDRNHEVKAVFAHKRLREFPVRGGPSTLRESVYKPELVKMSEKLLRAINWYGVAMVEYKEDPRDGLCKIMEINPRFWGSLPLAIAAGVDFPYMLYKMVVDGDVESVLDYPEGTRCRWLLPGDILHFLTNPKRFKLEPSFFNFSKNNRTDDFISWEDPGPTFGFFLIALVNLLNVKKWKYVFCR